MMKALLDVSDDPSSEKKDKFQKVFKDFYRIKSFLLRNEISDHQFQVEAIQVWRNFYREQANRYNLDIHLLDDSEYLRVDFKQLAWTPQQKSDQHVYEKFMMEVEKAFAKDCAGSINKIEAAEEKLPRLDKR